MQVKHVRSGKMMRLASPQHFLARERSAVDEAWPGDVIGVMDRGTLRIGDTLSCDGDLEFQGIPRFAPEHFARVIIQDPLRRKQLDTGLRQLSEEGAAQVFYTSGTDTTSPTPIVGAVGLLQFDVMLFRLETEYGVSCRFERLTARYPRWVQGDPAAIDRVVQGRGCTLLYDAKGNPLLLFEDNWALRWTLERETALTFLEAAP
jgi:peptide chain release factor 3